MRNPEIFIAGRGGHVGRDLTEVCGEYEIPVSDSADQADIVALCTPSHIAGQSLERGDYSDKLVIDFSGAAKRRRLGQYGLMLHDDQPWAADFDPQAQIFGNPGCIASAVILGLRQSGLTESPPKEVSVFAIGGSSYAHSIDDNELKLGRRLHSHPHVPEIQAAFRGKMSVNSFMPAITAGVDRGLLVTVSGKTQQNGGYRLGSDELLVSDVAHTSDLRHRLELNPYGTGYNLEGFNFSLGVVIDNLRFVTRNAVRLIQYLGKNT